MTEKGEKIQCTVKKKNPLDPFRRMQNRYVYGFNQLLGNRRLDVEMELEDTFHIFYRKRRSHMQQILLSQERIVLFGHINLNKNPKEERFNKMHENNELVRFMNNITNKQQYKMDVLFFVK